MKVLKGLLTFIISFTLVVLITGLTISSTIKVVQNKIVGEVAKQIIINETEEKIDTKAIDDIVSYEGTNEIINSVLDDYLNYLDDNSKTVSEKSVDSIINFVLDNKESLEKLTGEELNIEELTSPDSRAELTNALNEGFREINVDSNLPVKDVLTTYKNVTSSSFKTMIIIIIFVLIFLLALINFSLYKWTKPLGTVLITSGIFVLILYLFILLVLNALIKSMNINIDIDTSLLLIYGIVEVVVGIILLIIFSVINKNVTKKNNETQTIETINEVQNDIE